MNTLSKLFVGASALAVTSTGALAAIDGSKNLVCSPRSAFECLPHQGCTAVPLDEIQLPPFIVVDFEKNELREPGSEGREGAQVSVIEDVESPDGLIMVQGDESDLGWTMMVDKAEGRMTITASRADAAFAVFGSCIDSL